MERSEKKLRVQFQILECLHEIRFGEMSGKNEEEIHEFIDALVAESRKNDELVSWEDAKKQLRKKGKL